MASKLMFIRLSRAAEAIERVRVMLASRVSHDQIERALAREFGFEPLAPCEGEAHSNPHIDHCGACAPRWGFMGATIRVM
jgi:hypothetical protein